MAQARAGGSGTQISAITAIPKIIVSDITSSGATLRWANRPMSPNEIQRTAVELYFSLSYVLDHSEPDEVLGGDDSVFVIEDGLAPLVQIWVFMRNVYGGIKSEFTSTNFITLDAPVAPDPITSLALSYPNYKSAYTSWENPVTAYTNISRNLSMRYNYSNVYSNTTTLSYGTTNQTTSNITPSTAGNFVEAKLDYRTNLGGVLSSTVSTDWFVITQPTAPTFSVFEAFEDNIATTINSTTPLLTSDGFYVGYSTESITPTIPLPNQVYVSSSGTSNTDYRITGLSPGTAYYVYLCWAQNYTDYLTGSPAVATSAISNYFTTTTGGGGGGIPTLTITVVSVGSNFIQIRIDTSSEITPDYLVDGILIGYDTGDYIDTPLINEQYVYPDGLNTNYIINYLTPVTHYYITGCCIIGGVRGATYQTDTTTDNEFYGS